MLECVVNISEGRRAEVVAAIAGAGGDHVLDVHSDAAHHRSVLTLAGPDVEAVALDVTVAAVERLVLHGHEGVHPRLGVVDVVPFVALAGSTADAALAARGRFAREAARLLDLPCFLYGPERSLPDIRRAAFVTLSPDTGPPRPHPTAGATCVGTRAVLVAYNLWLAPPSTLVTARAIARDLRGPAVRALAFAVDGHAQVSCNLLSPIEVGPEAIFDAVAAVAPVARAELVGLVPAAVFEAVPPGRRARLDLEPARTIEARLEQAGLDRGSP